jgi:N-acetylglutamate synthase-like GNAT family acetyltransferase
MRMNPDIRPAVPADREAILALLAAAELPVADLAANPRVRLWVAPASQGIAGVVGLERFADTGLLRSLAVAPAVRRRGLATTLVRHVEREARAAGLSSLVLLTDTARPLFSKLEYAVVERETVPAAVRQSSEFQALCPASATCMSKPLA